MIQIQKGQTFTAQLTVMRTEDATTTQFLLSGCRDLAFNAVGRERQYALDGFTYKDNVLTATVNTALLDEGIYTLTARGRYMGDWWRAKTVALFEVVATGGELPTEPVSETATAVFSLHKEVPGILTRLQTLETKPAGVTPEDLQNLQTTLVTKITEAQRQTLKDSVLYGKVIEQYNTLVADSTYHYFDTAYSKIGYYMSNYSCNAYMAGVYAIHNYVSAGYKTVTPPSTEWGDGSSGTDSDGNVFTNVYGKWTAMHAVKVIKYTDDSQLKGNTLYWDPRYSMGKFQGSGAFNYKDKSGSTHDFDFIFPALQMLDFGTGAFDGVNMDVDGGGMFSSNNFTAIKLVHCPNLTDQQKSDIMQHLRLRNNEYVTWRTIGDFLIVEADWQ